MRRALVFLAPFLMAPDCGGSSSPGFGGGGSTGGEEPSDSAPPEEGSGGGMTDCEPEYAAVEVNCETTHHDWIWHVYVEMTATCPWIDVHFDGTSYGGQITGSGGVLEGDLAWTGAACDEPHTLDLQCVYLSSNYDCSYEYSP